MTYKEAVEKMNWKVAIYESKNSEKCIGFASSGWGMSNNWWRETYNSEQNGELWAVYKTPTGLRRTII
jgi:hypothetical protein